MAYSNLGYGGLVNMRIISWIKKGNLASGLAALGNLVIAVVKMTVAIMSGNGTMFATAMHSFADTVNQGFVFVGSVLSEMTPSKRFPVGFGRVINIFCMVAVIVVTLMAYETIKNGWELFVNPSESSDFFLNIIVLVLAFFIDGYVLYRTMKEIVGEEKQQGNLFANAFKYVKKAAPATKLVFYEDIVATLGAVLAIIGIVLSQSFGILKADGIISILIGFLMLFVAYRVGYDNMVGLIGVAAPSEVEAQIAEVIMENQHVVDINKLRVIQEGRAYHVDVIVELQKGMSLADADDVKFALTEELLRSDNVTDVDLSIIEDDEQKHW